MRKRFGAAKVQIEFIPALSLVVEKSICCKDERTTLFASLSRYLHVTGDVYGRPIQGQKEISCYSSTSGQNIWHVDAGVYVRPSTEPLVSARDDRLSLDSFSRTADHLDAEL